MKTGTIALYIWVLSGVLWTALAVVEAKSESSSVSVAAHADTVVHDSMQNESRMELASAKSDCVNVNVANADELNELPGIGPVASDRIIAYRTRHGKFTSMADLDKVKGIGPVTLKKLQGMICW